MKKDKTFAIKLKGKRRFTRLLGDPFNKKGLRAGLVVLKPKESIGEHKTEHKEEVIVILNGSATVYFGKNKKLMAPQNTFVYIPPETLHNVKNSGSKSLRYLYVTTRIHLTKSA